MIRIRMDDKGVAVRILDGRNVIDAAVGYEDLELETREPEGCWRQVDRPLSVVWLGVKLQERFSIIRGDKTREAKK